MELKFPLGIEIDHLELESIYFSWQGLIGRHETWAHFTNVVQSY